MTTYSPKYIIKFLLSKGRIVDRQKGSHCILYFPKTKRRTVVPLHKKDLPVGTLSAILKQTDFSKDDL